MKIVALNTTRTHYSAEEASYDSLTVKELMEILDNFDPDTPVVFSNDNGYTYGFISEYHITEENEEEDENEE